MTTTPAELRPGDRIPTDLCGALTVLEEPFYDKDDEDPIWDRVYVDVEPEDQGHSWLVDHLPAASGAEAFQFLGLRPLRYRLTFLPDTDIPSWGSEYYWPCGCLINEAGAHRVHCPEHPEGVRGDVD